MCCCGKVMSFRTENQAKPFFRNTGNRKGLDERKTESVTEQARIKDRTRLVRMRMPWHTKQLFWECNRQKSRCSIPPAAPNCRAPQTTYLRAPRSDSRSLSKGETAGMVPCESLNLKQTFPEQLQSHSSLAPAADVQKSTSRW